MERNRARRAAPAGLRWSGLRTRVLGEARDPLAPEALDQLSLAAFLGCIGLGANALSSSIYGPAQAFRALGGQSYLAVVLAIAMMGWVRTRTLTRQVARPPRQAAGGLSRWSRVLPHSRPQSSRHAVPRCGGPLPTRRRSR